MKRLISVLLTLLTFLMLSSAALADGETTLLRYAMELGRTLDAMPISEELLKYTDRSDVSALVEDHGKGNRTTPSRVVSVECWDMVEANLQEYSPDLPEQAKRSILAKNLPLMLVDELAGDMISSFSAQVTFAAPDVTGQGGCFIMRMPCLWWWAGMPRTARST